MVRSLDASKIQRMTVSWRIRIGLIFIGGLALGAAENAGYFPPPDKDGGWRTANTSAAAHKLAGMDLDRLDRAFEFEKETSQHGGLVIVRHGYLVYEKYFGKGNREAHPDMASIGKAFTSISCGIMLNEKRGQIPEGLDQKVFTEAFLPDALPLSDPLKADIRLGNLLTMTAGMHGDGANPGMVHGRDIKLELLPRPTEPVDQDLSAVRVPLWTKPGGGYSYSSQSPHVASIVLRNLTGMELQDYINLKPVSYTHLRAHETGRNLVCRL